MKDMMKMMQQAKNLQKNMENVQAQLAQTEVTGEASGHVKITMTCTQDVRNVEIAEAAAGDAEMLQDLVQVALEDALAKAKQTAETEMQKVTGGLKLPGM